MSQRTPQIGDQQRELIGPGAEGELFAHRSEVAGEAVRLTADGAGFTFNITWGTAGTRTLKRIQGPLSADFVGNCGITPVNGNDEPARAEISAQAIAARGPCLLREYIDARAEPVGSGPVAVQLGAARIINPGLDVVTYTAPDGSVITLPIDVNTNGRPFPIQSGSTVTAGRCFVEYEI